VEVEENISSAVVRTKEVGRIAMGKIRTRFAPSPTGRMHVGNLRTALYAYLVSKHENGDFILRIEDTDQERYQEGAVDIIYRTLKGTGLIHDEGPDKDGGVGPYVQSERQAQGIYMEYAKQLVEKGEAYYCFCDKERLDSLTEEMVDGKAVRKYDKHCLHLSKEEVEAKLASGMPYVIRQNVPEEGETSFEDELYGTITVPNAELDDMILIKSDGYPTYNFANVVDDHLMGITHVVRGQEYLSSSPKYNRLYQAFGWEVPVYIHCPTITNEEHQKLSKRSGHSSYEDLLEQGFLTEAIVNFVALLGWSPEDNQEIFSLEELVKVFDYHHISKSPAVFDMVKLKWMNGEYIKAMDFDRFKEMAMPYVNEVITRDVKVDAILELVKTRIEVFLDIKEHIDFFQELPDYDVAMYTHKKMKTNSENALEILKEEYEILGKVEDWSLDTLHDTLMEYIAGKGIKNGTGLWPVRTAVSGKQMTPGGAFEIMDILGKEESLRRMEIGIQKLEQANA
jgi:glutamyl-tRNA synthetase